MTLDQTMTVLEHAKHDALHPYIVAWDEEAQEWRPVTEVGFRHAKYAVYVWRSMREDGDAKTELSHPCWRSGDGRRRTQRALHPSRPSNGSMSATGRKTTTWSSQPASARR